MLQFRDQSSHKEKKIRRRRSLMFWNSAQDRGLLILEVSGKITTIIKQKGKYFHL